MESPSLSIFLGIFNDTVLTWYDCKPYAITPWAVEFLFYLSLILTLFYLYVIGTIGYRRIRKAQFTGNFYNCAFVLALGEIVTLLTCSRATIPTCALKNIPARYLAWESIGVFCVDIIYGVNLVMATIRLNAVFLNRSARTRRVVSNFDEEKTIQSTNCLNIFLLLEFLWALSMATLYFNGFVKIIWFEGINYLWAWQFPFNYRTSFNLGQLCLTFLIYCFAFIRLRKIKVSLSSSKLSQENRFLLLAILIFFCELFFIYSSDWVGYSWGIGSADFNANVAYFGKPLSTGITPFFYIIFSSEVRHSCCRRSIPSTSKIQPSISKNIQTEAQHNLVSAAKKEIPSSSISVTK